MPFKYLEFLEELIISVCSLLFLALTAYEIISKKWHSIQRMHRQRKERKRLRLGLSRRFYP